MSTKIVTSTSEDRPTEPVRNNQATRVPLAIVADISWSMEDSGAIKELNEGLIELKGEAMADERVMLSAEIAVVTFGNGVANVHTPFVPPTDFDPPKLTGSGGTPMGAGVNLALDLIAERQKVYNESAVSHYYPWMLLLADGHPTDDISSATARIHDLESQGRAGRITVLPVGCGESHDLSTLQRFSTLRSPVRVRQGAFKEMFRWISQSIGLAAGSNGNLVSTSPMTGWAQVPTSD